jgi:xanthine dehydrogenase iron-sulfur cluster and FAD-binding subunit A
MIKLKINGQEQSWDGDPDLPLLWFLRDEVGLTGTKFGCGEALCGAGRPKRLGISSRLAERALAAAAVRAPQAATRLLRRRAA